jgi:hypothetical protein
LRSSARSNASASSSETAHQFLDKSTVRVINIVFFLTATGARDVEAAPSSTRPPDSMWADMMAEAVTTGCLVNGLVTPYSS